MRRRTAIVAIALAGVSAGALTQAQAAPDRARSTQKQDERQGINNARAEGIKVDPAVEDAMARAPIGSCPNDPSQDKCPPVTAVKSSPVGPGEFFAEGTAKTARKYLRKRAKRQHAHAHEHGHEHSHDAAGKPKARAAHAGTHCWLSVQYPYYSVQQAHANGSVYCVNHVSSVELYMQLKKYYNGNWVLLDTDYKGPAPGSAGTLRGYASFDCRNVVNRTYAAVGDAYSVLNGTMYGATLTRKDDFACP